jgi:hypothetical protein
VFNNIVIGEIRIAVLLLPPKENVIRQREVTPVRKDGVITIILAKDNGGRKEGG